MLGGTVYLIVLHRPDSLLQNNIRKYATNNPRPHSYFVWEGLAAFLDENLVMPLDAELGDTRGGPRFTNPEEISRILASWPEFCRNRGFAIFDSFWNELVIDTGETRPDHRMVIRTTDSHPGDHFVCAVIERRPGENAGT